MTRRDGSFVVASVLVIAVGCGSETREFANTEAGASGGGTGGTDGASTETGGARETGGTGQTGTAGTPPASGGAEAGSPGQDPSAGGAEAGSPGQEPPAGAGGVVGGTGNSGAGGPGACPPGERDCLGECIGELDCCGSDECAEGTSCVDHVCTCNDGTKSCGTECIPQADCCTADDCPDGAACDSGSCLCPEGTHQCEDACVSNTSPDSCGTSCEPCQVPTGGGVDCDGVQCIPTCPSGQRPCLGECILDTEACTGECPSGSHDCSGVCVLDTSVNGCGEACTPCPVPANGQATCDGTSCGFTCSTNYLACESACIAESACCIDEDCGVRETCTANECVCDASSKDCNGTCIASTDCCVDTDCEGNASCTNNACVCDPGWAGADCSLLIFEPVPFPTGTWTACRVNAISGDGSTLAGCCDGSSGTSAFRRRAGTLALLANQTGNACAMGVNRDGSRIVGWTDYSNPSRVAASWTGTGSPNMHLSVDAAMGAQSTAYAVNADGTIIVGGADGADMFTDAVYWDLQSGSLEPVPVAYNSMWEYARDVSADGNTIVGTLDESGLSEGWVWTPDTARVSLPPLGGGHDTSGALGVSSDGAVVVGWEGTLAYRWDGTTPSSLGATGAAWGVNSDGTVIVGGSGSVGSGSAFVWTSTSAALLLDVTLADLGADITGWTLTHLVDVTEDGTVLVGYGTNPSGAQQGFVVHLEGTGIGGL